MASTKLGNKHTCFHCGRKFYDFGKTDVLCPSCGADQKTGISPEQETEAPAEEILDDDAADELDGDEVAGDDPVAEGLGNLGADAGSEPADEDFEDEAIVELGDLANKDLEDDDLEDGDLKDEDVDDY